MNLLKILTPLSLLFLAYLNTTYQNEVIVSAKDDIEFEAKGNKITNIVAEKKSKEFDWSKDTHGIMLPRCKKETIYLDSLDYIMLTKQ